MKFTATAQAAKARNLDLLIRSIIVPRVAAAVTAACDIVLAEATRLAPVRSGDLRDSGKRFVEEQRGRIGGATNLEMPHLNFASSVVGTVIFTSGHASFVEFGTGLRGVGTYPFPLPQEGVPITGRWIYDYKKQDWVGMPAQPYLRPALETSRPAIVAIFQSEIATAKR